jgi:hypothetical protein|tara:strand:+ start:305 stop:898 length:594 start_codon:yes stop_codon:yes gene_type:complete
MSKVYFLLFALSLSVSLISAQEAKQELSLTNSSVKEKFNYLMINSNNYQDFKVVKKSWLSTVKRQVLDSLEKQKLNIKDLNVFIDNQDSKNKELEATITSLNTQIENAKTTKENINFVGKDLKKNTFKSLFWSIVSITSILLFIFVYKYKKSNMVTEAAKDQLADIEKEYESHKKTALEREQKVMRKLQDELNKNRK